MKMLNVFLLMMLLVLLCGCVTPLDFNNIPLLTPEDVTTMSTENLCKRYPNGAILEVDGVNPKQLSLDTEHQNVNHQLIKNELLRRKVFNSETWQDIDSGRLSVGDPELAAYCVLGTPDAINSSSNGPTQLVFGTLGGGTTYIYVQNGVIVSWQESE